MNGSVIPDRSSYIKKLETYTLEILKDMSGISEIDGKPSEDAEEGEEAGKLYGAFTILGYIGDIFLRRFG